MSFETALRARLRASAGLTGVAIEWGRRPEGQYPAVVLTIVTDTIGQHMTGLDGWRRPRVQADVLALDAPTKAALRNAYVAAIAPSALTGGVRFGRARGIRVVDMSEQTDTDFVHRDMIEAALPHQLEN